MFEDLALAHTGLVDAQKYIVLETAAAADDSDDSEGYTESNVTAQQLAGLGIGTTTTPTAPTVDAQGNVDPSAEIDAQIEDFEQLLNLRK